MIIELNGLPGCGKTTLKNVACSKSVGVAEFRGEGRPFFYKLVLKLRRFIGQFTPANIGLYKDVRNNVNGELHIIIVDNCSPNDSFEALVKKYQSENRVSVIKNQSNDGYAKGINFGYDYAKVKEPYIMFADQDDVWLSDKIQKTYAVMKKTEKSGIPIAVHTDLRVVDSELQTISPSYYTLENREPRANDLKQLLTKNTAAGCTMMINRPLVDLGLQHSVLMKKTLHDWGYMLLARLYGEIVFINEPTILYRQHEDNSVGAKDKKGFRYKAEQCLELFKGKKMKYIKNSVQLEKDLVKEINMFLEKDNQYYEYICQYQKVQKEGKLRRMMFYYKTNATCHSVLKVWRVLFV